MSRRGVSRARSLLRWVAAGVVVLAVCGGAAAAPAGLPAVSTVTTTKGPIMALAQDGDRIVWYERLPPPADTADCDSGHAGVMRTLVLSRPRPELLWDPRSCSLNDYRLALAGSRVVWADFWVRDSQVRTMTVGQQQPIELEGELGLHNETVLGAWFVEAAGDGNLLAYSVQTRFPVNPGCDPTQSDCEIELASHAKRVFARKSRRLRGVHGRQIAVAAPNIASLSHPEEVAPKSVVDVRNATTGRPLTSFEVGARPRDLALTSRYVIVLLGGKRASIVIHDVHTGARVRTVAVGRSAHSLTASERAIVYQVGTDIYAIRLPSFAARLVARAPRSGMRSASIEGSRVIWADRAGSGSRIRAIDIG